MVELVVGVVLTAVVGGLLVPAVKGHMDWRRERFIASGELLETLAASLWTYWKLAMRVAYYGRKGSAFSEEYAAALKAWDSDEAWDNGAQIQIEISRSKRLLPDKAHMALDEAQRIVVEDLDKRVDRLRETRDTTAWIEFYDTLYGRRRDQIQWLLFSLNQNLDLVRQGWLMRRWRTFSRTPPAPIGLDPKRKGTARSQPSGDSGESESGAAGARVELAADDADQSRPGK